MAQLAFIVSIRAIENSKPLLWETIFVWAKAGRCVFSRYFHPQMFYKDLP